jgi:hypothetical protein
MNDDADRRIPRALYGPRYGEHDRQQQKQDARAETEAHLETSSGFIDERARGEYMRLGAGCFLVAVTNAHSALLAIVFARNGYDLHDIGLSRTDIADETDKPFWRS